MTSPDVPRSIGRVLDLLEVVVEERTCTLTEAAGGAGLTPTTALRYLKALETRGYLRRDDSGGFSPGPAVNRLAIAARDDHTLDQLIGSAQPHLAALAQQTGESTYLALRGQQVATYIAMAGSDRALRHVGWVGQEVTLNGTAVGAAFEQPGTLAIRTGAVEPDITAMSMAFGPLRRYRVAISVVGPSHRVDNADPEELETMLRSAATSIESHYGLTTPPGEGGETTLR